MASKWYNKGLQRILNGEVDFTDDTIKLVLVKSTYESVSNFEDQVTVDDGTGDDVASHECDATGYTGGFAGADRLTVACTVTVDNSMQGAHVALADTTWTGIGGGTNNTLGGCVVIKEVTNDAASYVLAFLDFTNTATNGSDITLDFATAGSDGNLKLTST